MLSIEEYDDDHYYMIELLEDYRDRIKILYGLDAIIINMVTENINNLILTIDKLKRINNGKCINHRHGNHGA